MSEKADNNLEVLGRLGVSSDSASIYLYLAKNGEASALGISKAVDMARTKVYRELDKLIEDGLVEQVMGNRGFSFRVTGSEYLNALLAKKKSEITRLEEELPSLQKMISLNSNTTDKQRVTYFKGTEGFKQVTWNSLRAERNLYIFEMASDMSVYVDQSFSEEVRSEFVKRRIHVSQITNLKSIPEYTDVTDLVTKYWDVRYVDPKVLKLTYEVLIYNDIVAMYNMRGNNIFCVEIHDENLATMQKQLFNYVWESSKKMQKIGEHGEAKVVDSTSKV